MVCLNILVAFEERLLSFLYVFISLPYYALNHVYIHEETAEIQNIIRIKISRLKESCYKFNTLKVWVIIY